MSIKGITFAFILFIDRRHIAGNDGNNKPHIASVDGATIIVPSGDFESSPDFMRLLGYSAIPQRHLLPILQKRGILNMKEGMICQGSMLQKRRISLIFPFNDLPV